MNRTEIASRIERLRWEINELTTLRIQGYDVTRHIIRRNGELHNLLAEFDAINPGLVIKSFPEINLEETI